jgi:hypothetical protein
MIEATSIARTTLAGSAKMLSMRTPVDKERLQKFLQEIARSARSPGRIYLVGGVSALLLDIRPQTIDIDIKMDPEPEGAFEAIARLKDQLDVNVELSSPDLFLPPLPEWEKRSEFIAKIGDLEVFHYDFYSQALAKISRGFRSDVFDARAFVRLGKVDPTTLRALFEQIKPQLLRYPAIDQIALEKKVAEF